MHFLELPEDLLIQIVGFMTPRELLRLKQTCRGMYAFGSMDVVWHNVRIDTPLSTHFRNSRHIRRIPAKELQPHVMRALRLDANWRLRHPAIKCLRQLDNEGTVSKMQLLQDSQWLLAFSRRNREETWISLWDLREPDLPPPSPIRFQAAADSVSAAIIGDGSLALVATVYEERAAQFLTVYEVPLDGGYFHGGSSAFRSETLLTTPLNTGYPFLGEIQVYQNLVAVTVVKFEAMEVKTSVLLYHARRKYSITIELGELHPSYRNRVPQLRLAADRFILTNIHIDQPSSEMPLTISQYRLPEQMLPSMHVPPRDAGELQSSTISICELELISNYTRLFRHPKTPICYVSQALDRIATLIFEAHSDAWDITRTSFIHALPLDAPTEVGLARGMLNRFSLQVAAMQENVAMGDAGYRAVWVEHDLESNDYRMMKMVIPIDDEEPVQIAELFPPNKALPFRLEACLSLAFDDVSGRLCFGVLNSCIYIMDFA
ncbi:hypothetical protein HGRIS_003926 [Hohenbuehelia grisea]|uniref:F-box domain-containing protein n=1 Tax=Hohenbuehelia grisea TaxID=104357 RepID=A0ABR3JIJ8_9AGAR